MATSNSKEKWHPPLPKETKPNLITTLPPELRTAIYELVWGAPTEIFVQPTEEPQCIVRNRGLLRVSKQIRAEAMQAFCHHIKFTIFVDEFAPEYFEALATWLRKVSTDCGVAAFKKTDWALETYWVYGNRASLSAKALTASTLVQAVRESGADLAENTCRAIRDHGVKLDVEKAPVSSALTAGLVQALKLGKIAYDEGWSSEELARELTLLTES